MAKLEKTVAGITFVAQVDTATVAGREVVPARTALAIEVAIASKLITLGVVASDAFAFVRKAAKLRSVDLAKLLDVDLKSVSRWENGAPVPRQAWVTLAGLFAERTGTPPMTTGGLISAASSSRKRPARVRVQAA